jgi:hypothetical protein
MIRPKLAIAILCVMLIFTGLILNDKITLSLDWQHDIGMFLIFMGSFWLFDTIFRIFKIKSEK